MVEKQEVWKELIKFKGENTMTDFDDMPDYPDLGDNPDIVDFGD